MNLDKILAHLKATTPKEKILAAVRNPMVCFYYCPDEYTAMTVQACRFVRDEFFKAIGMPDSYSSLDLHRFRMHLAAVMFDYNPNARDVIYACRDEGYLDALIKWGKEQLQITIFNYNKHTADFEARLREETQAPVLGGYGDYKFYFESIK